MGNVKSLIVLTPGFPSSESDTTCLPMQQSLLLTLQSLVPELTIIVLSFQYPYHHLPYSWHGLMVIPFNGRNKGGLTKLLVRKRVLRTLKNIQLKYPICGLLSFWSNECGWVGKKYGMKWNIRHYCWVLGQDAKPENHYPRSKKYSSSELLALSDFIQDEFERNHGVRPAYVVPPGVDVTQFRDPQVSRDIDLLAAGSLIPLKQYELFIEVVKHIQKQKNNIAAMLIGAGPEKENLEELIKKYGLDKNILLTGELPHPEVLKLMQRSRIFLHPSSYEGFGCVCLEALQAGNQVISFCKPMITTIDHWTIVKDLNEMSARAIELLQKPGINFKPVTPYNIIETAKKFIELFKLDEEHQ